jgi:hypothetical protein
MQARWRQLLFAAVAASWGTVIVSAQSPPVSPALGKWKMNMEKSKFEPGPAPKSQERTYEDWGGGVIHATFVGTDAQDKPTFSEYAARYDGKYYPRVNRGSPTACTIALKKVDADGATVEFFQKEDGKPSINGTRTLSADRKVMTITYNGTDAKGQPMSAVMVFERP